MDKKSFKEKFPHLYNELEGGENKVTINSVRTDAETAEKTFCDKLHNFNPADRFGKLGIDFGNFDAQNPENIAGKAGEFKG